MLLCDQRPLEHKCRVCSSHTICGAPWSWAKRVLCLQLTTCPYPLPISIITAKGITESMVVSCIGVPFLKLQLLPSLLSMLGNSWLGERGEHLDCILLYIILCLEPRLCYRVAPPSLLLTQASLTSPWGSLEYSRGKINQGLSSGKACLINCWIFLFLFFMSF